MFEISKRKRKFLKVFFIYFYIPILFLIIMQYRKEMLIRLNNITIGWGEIFG